MTNERIEEQFGIAWPIVTNQQAALVLGEQFLLEQADFLAKVKER
jgi:hypothetical protein